MRGKTGLWTAAFLAAGFMAAGSLAGCGLFQVPVPANGPAAVTQPAASPAQQITETLEAVSELLGEIHAEKTGPQVAANPVVIAAPTTLPAPSVAPQADKQAQALSLLTSALEQLNATMQSAPTTQAQQQAVLATGLQTAQSAAVTFGGQYGALIAAGLGIVGLLIQGMTNSSKAHQAAQAANATAQALAGKLPPAAH